MRRCPVPLTAGGSGVPAGPGERVCAAGIYTAWTEPGAPGELLPARTRYNVDGERLERLCRQFAIATAAAAAATTAAAAAAGAPRRHRLPRRGGQAARRPAHVHAHRQALRS